MQRTTAKTSVQRMAKNGKKKHTHTQIDIRENEQDKTYLRGELHKSWSVCILYNNVSGNGKSCKFRIQIVWCGVPSNYHSEFTRFFFSFAFIFFFRSIDTIDE